ncbi:ribosomal protein L7/L12 [Nannocystis radixulma]|uniref:Ribosomal protein L7/L12 n=1 Tax=Nannocystis radixulma TaxID=2995305 RepID=A0ABT5BLH1_9BACT|nr:ribosomal protein L7/L12 [Nannocystis radixulma]MDC0675009.1 ribosomal protein L7/L12 [Nannocystis radixulma]
MAITRDEVVAYLGALGPGELQELILELEDLWGMEPAYTEPGHVTMGAPLDHYVLPGMPELEVVLLSTGPRRVQVMKAMREGVKLELAQARDLINATPSVIARGISRHDAHELQRELEAVGAKVEIRER